MERRPWSDPKARPLEDARPRVDPPPYRTHPLGRVPVTRSGEPAEVEAFVSVQVADQIADGLAEAVADVAEKAREVAGVADRAALEREVRRYGRRLNACGAGPVDVGKCAEHGYHASARVQTGRAHRVLEGTGDSMVAAVADLAARAEHATRKRGRR